MKRTFNRCEFLRAVPLDTAFHAVMADIVAGRKPTSEFDQALKDWQNNGGNQIRGEYEATLQPAQ